MDHGGIDARGVHLLQQIVFGEAHHLPVVRIGGLAAAPDVDLCVDDAHGVLLARGPWLVDDRLEHERSQERDVMPPQRRFHHRLHAAPPAFMTSAPGALPNSHPWTAMASIRPN